jgi:iron complex outermembrane receptor protein
MARSVRAAVIVAASLGLIGQCAYGQSPHAAASRSYVIPAGQLKNALALFSAQAGISVSYVPGLVDGKTSPGLNGSSDIVSALTKLLSGTGLQAEARSGSTFEILRAPQAVPLPVPVPPVADGSNAAPAQLPGITVTGQADKDLGYHDQGFVAQTTRSATRTDTPIAELAQSVQVVTQDAMRSQQSQTVADALANVSGVTISNGTGVSESVNVRGFTAHVMSDGNSNDGTQFELSGTPVAALERVEVLKGADSILVGAMQPGGVVNVVKKKPQADPVHELGMQTGSYGDWLTSIDLAGAVTENKIFTYRFVMSGERVGQDTYGYDGKRDFYVAPSLGFDYGRTHLVIGFEQNAVRMPTSAYTVLGPQGPYPVDTPLESPSDQTAIHTTRLQYDLREDLGQDWRFHSKAQYSRTSGSAAAYQLLAVTGLPGTGSDSDGSGVQTGFLPGFSSFLSYGWSTEQSITGKIRTGPVLQTVTAGFSYGQSWSSSSRGFGSSLITVPLGDGTALPPALSGVSTISGYSGKKTYDANPFLQDQITIGRLHVLASIGHPQEWGQQTDRQGSWTPNLGVLYQLTGSVSVYVNALRSFTPQTGYYVFESGGSAPPATGSSVEAGVKFSLLDDRLTMTAAVFRAAVKNKVVGSPDNPAFAIISPGNTSRGVELDATGRLLPGLNVIASYTYSSYQDVYFGFSQLPKHQASLWLTYDLQGERLHGWGVGVGEWVRSGYSATTDAGSSYPMPGQARTDASVYYRSKTWSGTLGVKNVFDRRLYGDYANSSFVEQEPGRLIYLTGTYNF